MKSFTAVAKAVPVTDTNAYAAGDLIGAAALEFDASIYDGGSGVIQSLRLVDQDKEQAAIDVIFFDENPSGTTFTNNGAFDVADADMTKVIGHVSILASDYCALSDNAFATKTGIGLAFKLTTGKKLYAALVARAAVTYTAATDLRLAVGILQDA